jgi:hypothetical protein
MSNSLISCIYSLCLIIASYSSVLNEKNNGTTLSNLQGKQKNKSKVVSRMYSVHCKFWLIEKFLIMEW